MSGLFDDEGKTPARGRKHRAAEEAVAGLVEPTAEEMAIGLAVRRGADPIPVEETFVVVHPDLEAQMRADPVLNPGHPFEASIKAAQAIADDIHAPGLPGFEKIGDGAREQFNRLPISLERRERIVNLIWDRTRFRTGRVEWRDLRDLLKEVVEQL